MDLSFKDRMVFKSILPQEGNMADIIIQKSLFDRINPTPQELQDSGFKAIDGGWKCTNEMPDMPLELIEIEIKYLQKAVEALDKNGKVNLDNIDLCNKISAL
jgi:hypothetical protein